ncbi:hypothetical protein FRB90_004739 [Tulasnella sp. 427]|nr:hypothetical protein FRB90_004739 [Tulasnella sp. 427]
MNSFIDALELDPEFNAYPWNAARIAQVLRSCVVGVRKSDDLFPDYSDWSTDRVSSVLGISRASLLHDRQNGTLIVLTRSALCTNLALERGRAVNNHLVWRYTDEAGLGRLASWLEAQYATLPPLRSVPTAPVSTASQDHHGLTHTPSRPLVDRSIPTFDSRHETRGRRRNRVYSFRPYPTAQFSETGPAQQARYPPSSIPFPTYIPVPTFRPPPPPPQWDAPYRPSLSQALFNSSLSAIILKCVLHRRSLLQHGVVFAACNHYWYGRLDEHNPTLVDAIRCIALAAVQKDANGQLLDDLVVVLHASFEYHWASWRLSAGPLFV